MIKVGAVTITPVFEVEGGTVIEACIQVATPEAIKKIDWLRPHYANGHGRLKAQSQSFLVEAGGKKIVVDTGVGNGRDRPELPDWANLQTDFMERFAQVFVPEEVDIVVCTHLHSDHIGWNTTLVDGQWVPTFPNAQYIFVEQEFNYWKNKPTGEIQDDLNGIDESVMPIYQAGLAKLVSSGYQICDEVKLIPTPGHTPGHVSVLIQSASQSAVISGDALHHPCQIAQPQWKTFDTDSDAANATRQKLLERFADTDTLFIGSHFAEPVAGKIVHDEGAFKLIEAES